MPDCRGLWKVPAREFSRSFKGNGALILRSYVKQNPARLFGNEFGEAICPFDHRNSVAKEIVVQTEPREGVAILHAKKIKMINRQSSILIFMHNRKGRAGNGSVAFYAGHE